MFRKMLLAFSQTAKKNIKRVTVGDNGDGGGMRRNPPLSLGTEKRREGGFSLSSLCCSPSASVRGEGEREEFFFCSVMP